MVDTLLDAGPLIALFVSSDKFHSECSALFKQLNCSYYTTMAVLTEAMYFLGHLGGHRAQEALWSLVHRGDLILEHPSPQVLLRMSELMDQYRDRPMDFADASLVALAERLSVTRIFTVDHSDFSIYRANGTRSFTILGPRA